MYQLEKTMHEMSKIKICFLFRAHLGIILMRFELIERIKLIHAPLRFISAVKFLISNQNI